MDQIVHVGHDTHGMTFQSGSIGGSGDFNWQKTNQPEADDFVSDNGPVVTDVDSIETVNGISLNELVCAYGASSNDGRCVLRTDAIFVTCGSTGSLMRMNGDTQIGGDSGGPWYRGGRAYGVHTGGCSTQPGHDFFSMVDLLDNVLNVAVQTS